MNDIVSAVVSHTRNTGTESVDDDATDGVMFPCVVCGAPFPSNESRDVHMVETHGDMVNTSGGDSDEFVIVDCNTPFYDPRGCSSESEPTTPTGELSKTYAFVHVFTLSDFIRTKPISHICHSDEGNTLSPPWRNVSVVKRLNDRV